MGCDGGRRKEGSVSFFCKCSRVWWWNDFEYSYPLSSRYLFKQNLNIFWFIWHIVWFGRFLRCCNNNCQIQGATCIFLVLSYHLGSFLRCHAQKNKPMGIFTSMFCVIESNIVWQQFCVTQATNYMGLTIGHITHFSVEWKGSGLFLYEWISKLQPKFSVVLLLQI